ncbi:MAG: enoyl-CoA hydratase, partial [Dehalococcoidia bacterium]|nr:enoyl-CoA hydratase [Dehalococcoidia bacterium]
MAYDVIKLDKQDRIAVLTLNRPEKLNTLNQELISELERVLAE